MVHHKHTITWPQPPHPPVKTLVSSGTTYMLWGPSLHGRSQTPVLFRHKLPFFFWTALAMCHFLSEKHMGTFLISDMLFFKKNYLGTLTLKGLQCSALTDDWLNSLAGPATNNKTCISIKKIILRQSVCPKKKILRTLTETYPLIKQV